MLGDVVARAALLRSDVLLRGEVINIELENTDVSQLKISTSIKANKSSGLGVNYNACSGR